MQLKISNGYVGYMGDTVLEKIDFEINDRDKIALVGRNGCGKTTLLKLMSGELELMTECSPEPMFVSKSRGMTIGVLRQLAFEDDSKTLEEEMESLYLPIIAMQKKIESLQKQLEFNPTEEAIRQFSKLNDDFLAADGYFYKKEYQTALKKFGFSLDDYGKRISQFSGGQRTRLALLKQLLAKPDLLLLDEPTNHLDIEAIEWIENYLSGYKKAVVLVSHDRLFLDNVINTVYEIERKTITKYIGNYTSYTLQKQERYQQDKKAFERQQREIADLSATVERFRYKANKAKMAQSKIKQIERMDVLTDPQKADTRVFKGSFTPAEESGNDVLFCQDLCIGYDRPLQTVTLEIKKGDKLGIIGGNGIGKSTFVKTLVHALGRISGNMRFGTNVRIGYFDQQIASQPTGDTLFDSFSSEYPRLDNVEVRNRLGRFLFTGDEVFKKISELSGGERVRLALCKLFEKRPNLLILDEPTNHMDILSKEALEKMLESYTGTLIFVSHDRYFVKRLATKILAFEPNSALFYPYSYDKYIQEKFTRTTETVAEETVKQPQSGKQSYLEGKERQRIIRRLQAVDEQLAAVEYELTELHKQYNADEISSDYVALNNIAEQISAKEEKMLSLMEEKASLQNK